MYAWRKMSDFERKEVLKERQCSGKPWHAVPFMDSGPGAYLLTAACYEHRPHIGHSLARLDRFSESLLATIDEIEPVPQLIAWVVLPNHYHFLCHSSDIGACKRALGRLHGRTSRDWNLEEDTLGRRVWFRAAETAMKSEAHYWATVNYIHHNPVKHRCGDAQDQWKWSSFSDWKKGVGREALVDLWNGYPVDDYGKDWDEEDLSNSVPPE